MIVDAHCHAGKGDGLTGPWDTAAPLEAYLRRARRAGIARTVLLPAFSSDYREANRALARVVAMGRGRFLGFAMVHPARDAGRVRELVAEAVEEHGLVGLKLHRHDARITREACEAARAHRLPVLYDVMGEVAPVDLLATEYPDVPFVIAHLGSFGDDWRAHLALTDLLVRHPNVHADTSGVRRFDYLLAAVRRAGPEKVLFGSDGPWLHPGLELEKVRMLGLSPRAEALVLGENLLRLTDRVRRRPAPAPGAPAPLGEARRAQLGRGAGSP